MRRAEEIKPLQKIMKENPDIKSLAEARRYLSGVSTSTQIKSVSNEK